MKPADELRKFFLDELKGLGVPLVKLRFSGNAELYSVESGSSGIVYLKVSRPEGKKIFWGLRKDFLDFLLGKKETSVSVLEFFIAVLKRDRGGTELPPAPEGQIPAHLRRWLLESEKKAMDRDSLGRSAKREACYGVRSCSRPYS